MRAILTASALTAAALVAAPAAAAPLDFFFNILTVSDDPAYDGLSGSGTVTIEDTLLTGVGEEILLLSTADSGGDPGEVVGGLLSLSVTMFTGQSFEQAFTQDDDVDFPDFPQALFIDGELDAIDFVVAEAFADNLTPIDAPDVISFGSGFFEDLVGVAPAVATLSVTAPTAAVAAAPTFEFTVVTTSEIPLPAAAPLMLVGLAGFAALRRKG